MKSLYTLLIGATLFTGVVLLSRPTEVQAQSAVEQIQSGVDKVSDGTEQNTSADSLAKTIINLFLYGIGAVAVVMIILAGFKYTTSNGDSAAVTSAKNTLLYAVVGLVVAILAYATVNFVVDRFIQQDTSDPFECGSSIDPGCDPTTGNG